MKSLLTYTFYLPVAMGVFLMLISVLDSRHGILRDGGTAVKKPFSFSKVQLAFWFIIIMSSFISIILGVAGHEVPTLADSTLILLGITTGTLTAGRLIDVADQNKGISRTQDTESEGFFTDILSDADGISLHRFQCMAFNLVFGAWFIFKTLTNLSLHGKVGISQMMPDLSNNNLLLLGISAGTYVALKANENKGSSPLVSASLVAAPVTDSEAGMGINNTAVIRDTANPVIA